MYPSKYYEKASTKDSRYIFLGNQRLGTIEKVGENTTLYLNFTDHLNSSSVTTDNQGNVTNLIDYMPFGSDRINVQNQGFNPSYKFTDQENDSESGLMNFDARYYEPGVGRFVQVDPLSNYLGYNNFEEISGYELTEFLANPQKLNSYAYALNNPIKYADPSGQDAVITINEDDKTITISANIYIYGPDANDEVAANMQSDIMEAWDKGWTYYNEDNDTTYSVKFDVKVEVTKNPNLQKFIKSLGLGDANNIIEIDTQGAINEGGSWVYNSGWSGTWRGNSPDAAPHEFGHLLGLDDRYSQNGANSGWEGNIMAEPAMKGEVEQRNINTIVSPYIDKHNYYSQNARWFKPSYITTMHHLAPRGNYY